MPMPSPLISAEELSARLADDGGAGAGIRVVDCRWVLGQPGAGRAAYDEGHVPGAVFLDLDVDLAAPPGAGRHPLPDPAVFRERLESLGIGDDHLVVAYEDSKVGAAARLWWMLEDLGHDRVVVLDGGLAAWLGAGGSLTTAVPDWPPATLSLADHWTRTIDRDELVARLGRVTLLDARAHARYRGDVEPIDQVAGHIPTAISAPLDGNVDETGRFLPAAALRSRFAAVGAADTDRPVVTSCGSGVSACQSALGMRLAGLPDPILYAGSYSDWTRAGLPIATGDDPGEPPA
jgi:thiosulfate/3-mercaptopyruvate sulfurtransferase